MMDQIPDNGSHHFPIQRDPADAESEEGIAPGN